MKDWNEFAKRSTTSSIGKQAEKILRKFDASADVSISRDEVKVLLNELQVFRLELEMQNDELKVSYQSLEEERAKFVSLYDLAPVGYFILDYLGHITDVNQRGLDLLKISKNQVIMKRFQSFITTDSWEDFYSFLYKMQNSDSRQSIEMKLQLGNNEFTYARVEGIIVQNIVPSQVKYYIAVIDIKESRDAQINLLATKDRLEMTLKASSTGTWTVDTSKDKVYFDDYSYAIFGLKPWEFDGHLSSFYKLVHPEDLDEIKESLRTHGKEKEINVEFKVFTKAGQLKHILSRGHEVDNANKDEKCFAGILMDITERKRLSQEADDLRNGQQRLILSATLMAQENERSAISNALHDSVCQILYGIKLNLQNIQLKNDLNNAFVNINQLLDQAIQETRQISYELTPSVLKDFGFTAGIKEMAQRLTTSSFEVKTNIKTTADLLHPKVQLYLFRIIQELVNNSIKHANASRAEIKVHIDQHLVKIIVSDDGGGFQGNLDDLLRKGSGLRGIKNRVFLLDGEMDMNSTVSGTKITIVFRNDKGLSDIDSI
ncbi:PAS domain S-box-containing protein [Pedobacter sp. CAN_A7]|uniref:PAS domain-containing sensor histidine kinase n=1 Tax=Pedobacter sp. CAN_A7 TaxID=2787722 RepID=UPI0018CA85A3